MIERYRMSTHRLAKALLDRPEGPVRGVTVGRFVLIWDGKDGDYTPTIPTEELFSEKEDDNGNL